MTDIKAADLPVGSVVADRHSAWFKDHPRDWAQWRGTRGDYAPDHFIDSALDDGATVLRHGYGNEGES